VNSLKNEEETTMHIHDATPPADFPKQVVIAQDREFVKRHPSAAYWLRVQVEGTVRAIPLTGAIGPADARRMAQELGFAPSHYTDPGEGRAFIF
jgi:hypothetical protein